MNAKLKSGLWDFGAGALAGVATVGSSLLIQGKWQSAFDYMMLAMPAISFPTVSWFRAKRTSIPLSAAFFLVNIWLFLIYYLFSTEAPRISPLAIPLAVTTAGSLLCMIVSPRINGWPLARRGMAMALLIIVPAGIVVLQVPDVMGGILTYTVNEQSPNAVFHLLNGGTTSVAAQQGRVILLNFWGVWCGPCIRELPELNDAARLFANRSDATFIAVNSSIGKETRSDVSKLANTIGLTVPVSFEPDLSVYNAFKIQGLPTTVIIDRQGVIRYRRVGYATTARYSAWVTKTVNHLANTK